MIYDYFPTYCIIFQYIVICLYSRGVWYRLSNHILYYLSYSTSIRSISHIVITYRYKLKSTRSILLSFDHANPIEIGFEFICSIYIYMWFWHHSFTTERSYEHFLDLRYLPERDTTTNECFFMIIVRNLWFVCNNYHYFEIYICIFDRISRKIIRKY